MSLPLRARILLAVVAVAVVPVGGLGLVLVGTGVVATESPAARVVLLATLIAGVIGLLAGYLLLDELGRPIGEMADVVERVAAGDLGARIGYSGDDEVGRLAASHDRLAEDLERRNRELRRILGAVGSLSPSAGPAALAERAAADARSAFEMIDARIHLGDPRDVPPEPPIPGDPFEVRAELRSGPAALGVLVGRLPATRRWEPGDQDLLDLFGSEVGTALRNAELIAAKDDFLRGVSHNLQTPLARIRAYADQLAAELAAAGGGSPGGDGAAADRRPAIIAEQSERLSRMVRQLLTVSRIESGALRPTAEVLALAPRVRRAWEALGAADVPFEVDDAAGGWLAVADPDQLDQVLWALLDNAVKHGGGAAVAARIVVDELDGRIRLTIADAGPGIGALERESLFGRFSRGSATTVAGSGLGLYVSRQLCRAMDGELDLEPAAAGTPDPGAGPGAAFTIVLPAEAGRE